MPYFGIPIRNGLPIGLGSVAGFGIAPFSPESLFENGEQGVLYDPSDYSTLFTDSAGTTPVTGVEQFVGLMLDKSQGLVLGPELITPAANRDFSSDTGYWTKTAGVTITGGQCVYSSVATGGGLYRSNFVTAGVFYEVTFTIASISAGALRIYAGGSATAAITTPGTYTRRVCAGSVNTLLIFETVGTTTLVLDDVSVKIVTGNHAFQTSSAKRPKLAARYNLLQYTEQFDNGYWAKVNTTVTPIAAVAPNGTTTAELAYPTTSGTSRIVWNGSNVVTIVNGLQYVSSIYAKASGKSIVWFGTLAGNTADANCAFFDLQNQTASAGAYFSSAIITPVGDGWYLCKATATSASTVGYGIYGSADAAGSTSVTANGTDGVLIWGADLRPASQATGLIGPTYQRVAAANVYDTAGFLPYLFFDGLSWSMSTNSIDFSAGDKMTVWAGVRRLTEASFPMVCELSASWDSTNGTFGLSGGAAGGKWRFGLRGTAAAYYDPQTYTPPITNVLSASFDIAGAGIADEIFPRVNGVLEQENPIGANAGTGNFGNHPLFIGMRNNTLLPFNGWLTSLIIRGAQSTQSQIEATEAWVNSRTGAY